MNWEGHRNPKAVLRLETQVQVAAPGDRVQHSKPITNALSICPKQLG